MSELKKWINIVKEQLEPTIINATERDIDFQSGEVVMISQECGGGVGAFLQYTDDGCLVDVKGNLRLFSKDEISAAEGSMEDPFTTPNNQQRVNDLKDVDLKDKPDPQVGDLVQIENVYGTSIGSGFGVFMSYSTTGKEAIINLIKAPLYS